MRKEIVIQFTTSSKKRGIQHEHFQMDYLINKVKTDKILDINEIQRI